MTCWLSLKAFRRQHLNNEISNSLLTHNADSLKILDACVEMGVTHIDTANVYGRGRPDVGKGVDHPDFQRFIRLMGKHENIWTKVTCPERLTVSGPPYEDVIPYYQAVIERFEDRVLWGTDWPHPNMKSHIPDDGALVDYIPLIARTQALQEKLLVTNPMRLYWF